MGRVQQEKCVVESLLLRERGHGGGGSRVLFHDERWFFLGGSFHPWQQLNHVHGLIFKIILVVAGLDGSVEVIVGQDLCFVPFVIFKDLFQGRSGFGFQFI